MDRTLLSASDLKAALSGLPEWQQQGEFIARDLKFADFDAAMAFINATADVARMLDHHPNLTNVYNEVGLRVTTHDAGGVTALDIAFARAVDALLTPGR